MLTSLTPLSKSKDNRFNFGYMFFNFFSIPLEMMWLAMHPNGCRLKMLFAPQCMYDMISAGSSQPSPNCALKVMTFDASSASANMSLNGM